MVPQAVGLVYIFLPELPNTFKLSGQATVAATYCIFMPWATISEPSQAKLAPGISSQTDAVSSQTDAVCGLQVATEPISK
jgi:hypothetical protein